MQHEPKFLSAEQFLLTTLIVKLAVAAILTTMLVRFRWFRRILLTERRDWPERLVFAAGLGIPLCAGIVARLLLNYNAFDLSLEGAFLAGLIAGPYAGAIVGSLVGTPATIAGEFITLPFAVGCGFAGGGLREVCPKETIWRLSPLFFTGLHRDAWRFVRRLQIDWHILLIAALIALELLRQALGHRFGIERLFCLAPSNAWFLALVCLTTVLAVAIPIKIWNSARIEPRLEEQEQLLMAARIEALASQINPHFLFNTLTSISSLIRSEPETARTLIVKLSGLLRRLLRSQDHFVTLREELPDVLDVVVPSMILQPLVENSIKHGLSRKVGDGRITIRSRRHNGHAIIEVIDDGLGIPMEGLESAMRGGIGIRNVNERLQVIYGKNYRLKLDSNPGQGTVARIEIPELLVQERVTA
ncbi:MAG: histidine kinase [Acidobacteria bacterium]|nr:histidine kinase [Acidobacteriota bacterium]